MPDAKAVTSSISENIAGTVIFPRSPAKL